jgi:hypothetical protein
MVLAKAETQKFMGRSHDSIQDNYVTAIYVQKEVEVIKGF